MDAGLPLQIEFFERCRASGVPLVLATVVATDGSTYRKPGARMLIAPQEGSFAGLLSGGCLESDLLEHARAVLARSAARRVDYDMRSADDLLWGMGLGCEGAIGIFLQPLDPANGYRPLDYVADCLRTDRSGAVATITQSAERTLPIGASLCAGECSDDAVAGQILADLERAGERGLSRLRRYPHDVEAFLSPVYLPPRLLLAGAGPDAAPVARAAAGLGWRCIVVDHRPAYATPAHFPTAERVAVVAPDRLGREIPLERCDAAVVMSHHLPSDLAYLRALAASDVGYVGLLGPAARRERLFAELGAAAKKLAGRIYAPVGLDLGAQNAEAIALAIVAEIQAVLTGRRGGHMRDTAGRA